MTEYIKLIISRYLCQSKQSDPRLFFVHFFADAMIYLLVPPNWFSVCLSTFLLPPWRAYSFVSSPVKPTGINGNVNGIHNATLSTINVCSNRVQFLLAQDPENIFLQRGETHPSMEQQKKVKVTSITISWLSLSLLVLHTKQILFSVWRDERHEQHLLKLQQICLLI